MKLEEIIYRIIPEEYSDYHCFDMLKKYYLKMKNLE